MDSQATFDFCAYFGNGETLGRVQVENMTLERERFATALQARERIQIGIRRPLGQKEEMQRLVISCCCGERIGGERSGQLPLVEHHHLRLKSKFLLYQLRDL